MGYMNSTQNESDYSWHVPRLIAAWIVALFLALAVVLFLPADLRAHYLVLAIGVSAILSFILQLGTAQRDGFITRTSFSTIGSVLLIGFVQLGALIF